MKGQSKLGAAGRKVDGEDGADLGEGLEFMRLLWGINHALEAWSKRMDASVGVTGPQRLVIRIVGRFPGISAGRLATVLRVHPSTLTGVLGRLTDRGFLKREVDPGDGRRALFGLTPKGRELDALRAGTVEAKVRTTLSKLPATRTAATQEVLVALTEALAEPRARGADPAKAAGASSSTTARSRGRGSTKARSAVAPKPAHARSRRSAR
jgi:MarR family transcriptional regulator, organic hydroperoxide resistance regulator